MPKTDAERWVNQSLMCLRMAAMADGHRRFTQEQHNLLETMQKKLKDSFNVRLSDFIPRG